MKYLRTAPLAASLAGAAALAVTTPSFGHGGTYRGPGDTVPPGGGPGGPSGGPTSPGGSGPTTPGDSGPTSPLGPSSGGPGQPGQPGRGSVSGGGPPPADLTAWTFWWEFNKAPYLNLKDAIHRKEAESGSDGFYLGQGYKNQGPATSRPTDEQVRDVIVPALLAALERETDKDVVTACLMALAKIGDQNAEDGTSKFEGVIAPYLGSANQEIAETAAIALGILANDTSVATLSALLMDDAEGRALVGGGEVDYRTRAFAAYGLAQIGKRTGSEVVRQTIVDRLVTVLESERSAFWDVKVAALIALGMTHLDTLDPPVDTPPEEVRPSMGQTAQLDYVLAFLRDEEQNDLVRAHAPTALARLVANLPADLDHARRAEVEDKVAEALLEPLGKRSKDAREVVQSCVVALGLLADNDADPLDVEMRKALIRASSDLDEQSKRFALIALAQAGGRMGEGDEPDAGVKEAWSHLGRRLGSGNQAFKPWAGMALGVLGHALGESDQELPKGAAVALRTALVDETSPQVYPALAIGAGLLGDHESKPILRDRFQGAREDEARGYTAVALGLLRDHEAKRSIQNTLKKSEYRPELLKQCAIALGLLGDKDVGLQLVDMLKRKSTLASQAAIATALGFIGDTDSVDPLVDLLREAKQPKARAFAAVALGVVADKERLPWNSKIAVGLNYRAATGTLNNLEGTGILNIL